MRKRLVPPKFPIKRFRTQNNRQLDEHGRDTSEHNTSYKQISSQDERGHVS